MATARFSREGDALVLGVVQVGVVGVLGMGAAFAFEQPALPTGAQQWGAMLELVAVCTVFGFTVQPMAQRFVSVDTAGLFCAITPLVGGVLGVSFLHEPFGPATLAGMGLILAAIAVSAVGGGAGMAKRKEGGMLMRRKGGFASKKMAGVPGFEPR